MFLLWEERLRALFFFLRTFVHRCDLGQCGWGTATRLRFWAGTGGKSAADGQQKE